MVYSTDFHLCAEGEKLYLDWSRLDALTTMPLACMRARAKYKLHRKKCAVCTPPVRLEMDDATIR